MEFRQLLQFYEVCKQGSFSAAGERLYMTQQAVGKSMKQLEDELAVILFVREKSGVSLTPQGQYLESRCEKLFDFIHETEDQIQLIGANCPLRPKILIPQAGAEEMQTNEKIYQEILQSPIMSCMIESEVSEDRLAERNVDAVIQTMPSQNPERMSYPLLNISMCAALHESDHSVTKKEMMLRDFRNRDIILMESWQESNKKLLRSFHEQNIALNSIKYVKSMKEGLKRTAADEGIFILPERDYKMLAKKGTQMIPIKKRSYSLNLFFISRKKDPCQREILRVYEFLKVRLLHF